MTAIRVGYVQARIYREQRTTMSCCFCGKPIQPGQFYVSTTTQHLGRPLPGPRHLGCRP